MGLFEYWPYSNFHELNADWLLNRVKQMSDYLNNLPDLVQDWISEGLSDIDINQKILDAMTQFGMAINVVAPPNDLDPAKTDGSEDATATIQGCIDYAYAQGGGVVFFPAGRYLTGPLTLKDKVVLLGFADECTKLTLKGGSTSPLITANGSNMAVMGLTLDGNAEVQTEDLTLVSMMATDVDYRDVTFTGGFILLSHNMTGGACNILNCQFKTCVQHAAVFTGAGNLNVLADFDNLSATGGESVIENHVDNANMNIRISATAPVGLDLEADECAVAGWIGTGVTTPIKDEGVGNYVKVFGNLKKETYKNKYVDVDGDYVINDGDYTHTSENQTMTAMTKMLISGQDVELDPTNPLTYKTPQTLNSNFKYVQFKDVNGDVYNVLVEGETEPLGTLATVKNFGAVGDGVTDDTEAFKAAGQNSNLILVDSGTFVVNTCEFNKDMIIIGIGDSYIKPVFVGGVPNCVFRINGNKNVIVKNIEFIGEKSGAVNYNVMRQSCIEIYNSDVVLLENVSYNNVTDAITDIEQVFKNRKGCFLSIKDCNNVIFNNIKISGNENEESIWIAPVNKEIEKINVKIDGIRTYNTKGLSILDIIANNITLKNAYSDETDNIPNYSWTNFFANHITVEDCEFYGVSDIYIDSAEEFLYKAITINISNCYFGTGCARPLALNGDIINISKCVLNGETYIKNQTGNASYLTQFEWLYNQYRKTEIITIENCDITLNSKYNGLWIYNSGGQIEGKYTVNNCIFDGADGKTGVTNMLIENGDIVEILNTEIKEVSNSSPSGSFSANFDILTTLTEASTDVIIVNCKLAGNTFGIFIRGVFNSVTIETVRCSLGGIIYNYLAPKYTKIKNIIGELSNAFINRGFVGLFVDIENKNYTEIKQVKRAFNSGDMYYNNDNIIVYKTSGYESDGALGTTVTAQKCYTVTGGAVLALNSGSITDTSIDVTSNSVGDVIIEGNVYFMVCPKTAAENMTIPTDAS